MATPFIDWSVDDPGTCLLPRLQRPRSRPQQYVQNPTTLAWKISITAQTASSEETAQTSGEEQEPGDKDQESPGGSDHNLPSFTPGDEFW